MLSVIMVLNKEKSGKLISLGIFVRKNRRVEGFKVIKRR